MNRVHQCINCDGWYLTDVVFKSNFIVIFLNNGQYLSSNSLYFEQTFNKLWSTSESLTMLNEC